jgi:hypothetical protein
MKTPNVLTSACRSCRYFQPEGRRGGLCQQLGAPVRGSWKACSLALPPFAPSWETLEGIMLLSDETLKLQDAKTTTYSVESCGSNVPEEKTVSTPNPAPVLA